MVKMKQDVKVSEEKLEHRLAEPGIVALPLSTSVSHSVVSALCDPMDCSPPGSSVHGIPQARIL